MPISASVSNSEFIGYGCFIIGTVLLVTASLVGIIRGPAKARTDDAKAQLNKLKQKLDTEIKPKIRDAAGAQPGTDEAATATTSAEQATESAKTALDQVGALIGALPEGVRFLGLIVLVGTVLIGVATIQFGGVSLF